jgi:Smg protein
MKQTVLDILQFLFDHCVDEEGDLPLDRGALQAQLMEVGFDQHQVEKAFDWLQAFSEEPELEPRYHRDSLRVYAPLEQEKLGIEGMGLIHLLEQSGVLEHRTRELVINRVMALEGETVELLQLKWIVFMVLVNQPNQDTSVAWLDHLFSEGGTARKLH